MSSRAALTRVWLALAGVVAGTVYGCGSGAPIGTAAVGAAGIATLFRRRSSLRLVGVAAIAFGVAGLGASIRCSTNSVLEAVAHDVPACAISGRVLESAGGLGTLVGVETLRCRGYARINHPGIVVVDGALGDAGSGIEARGWLFSLTDDDFDVARRRLGANAYFDVAAVRLTAPDAAPLAAAASMKHGLLRATSGLEKRKAALLRGITIGDTKGFNDQTLEVFRRAGLSHLLAVSGENVAIVLGAIAIVAARLALRSRLLLAAAALVMFVLVVGPEPSVLRAALMGAISLAALAFGRRAEPLHALGLALILLVCLRPGMVFSVGLHLSAAATAGIVLWSGSLARHLAFLPSSVALGLAATLGAQLAVAPVLIVTFGEVSLAGPLANLLAVPAVPPATIVGLLAGLAGVFNQDLGALVARFAAPFAGWIVWVADTFGSARWAAVDLPRWCGWVLGIPVALSAAIAIRQRTGARESA